MAVRPRILEGWPMGIVLIVAMVLIYAMLFIPQQRRAKAQRQMLAALDVGDEVLTSAGMYGEITEFDGETVFLAVSDDLEIKITRASIAERVVYSDDEDE